MRSCSPSRAAAASGSSRSGSSIHASGNACGHPPVHVGVGDHVDRRALVVALEVHRVDRAGGGQLGHQLVGPGVGGIELEARAGVALQQRGQLLGRLGLALGRRGQAHRDHVVQRPGSAADHLAERLAGLAQRQVQRRRLERPAAVVARGLAHRRRVREQVQAVDQLGQLAERGRDRSGPAPGPRPGRRCGRAGRRPRPRRRRARRRRGGRSACRRGRTPGPSAARAPRASSPRSRPAAARSRPRWPRGAAYAGTTTTGVSDRWSSLCGVEPRIAPFSGLSP